MARSESVFTEVETRKEYVPIPILVIVPIAIPVVIKVTVRAIEGG